TENDMKTQYTLLLTLVVMLLALGCQDVTERSATDDAGEESTGIGDSTTSNDPNAGARDPAAALHGGNAPPPQSGSDQVGAAENATGPDGDNPAFADVDSAEPSNSKPAADVLAPGNEAPAIDLAAVVHGPEVRPFSGDHVVVVEFWATWCGPCIRNMPHISALQKQYGSEVQFIGVTDEDEDTVMEFLGRETGDGETEDGETWGDVLSYSIALDSHGKTETNFMRAASQNAIPCAFVVNRQGRIAWIGHPASIDEPLSQIVSDTWDIEQARQQFLARVQPAEPVPAAVFKMPELIPGMPAPPVQLASVVHGNPFDGQFVKGKTYVIEFWATWCRPCLSSMPHISALQTVFGDAVQFVGVSAEEPETVTAFLDQNSNTGSKWSKVVKYSIGVDDEHTTTSNYMEAADQSGIPCAFIIDQNGDVAWIGHPTEIDDPLQQVVEGSFDIERAAVLFRAERELQHAIDHREFDSVLELLSELSKNQTSNVRFQHMQLELLGQLGRWAEYSETAAVIVESNLDNHELLNMIAWEIAAKQTGDGRDLDLALKAALRASEATMHRHANILDTVARVYYEQGNLRQAVIWQEKAVNSSPRTRLRRHLRDMLAKYKSELSKLDP
ncbi:MAG: redoxin family protein, partial [Planctomycetaceae bacterium]